jgi:hypothetical protein
LVAGRGWTTRQVGSRVAVAHFATASQVSSQAPDLPERAKTVIIGGGCIGCGIAYSLVRSFPHLPFPCAAGCNQSQTNSSLDFVLPHQVKAGERDVVVLEKEPALANVTTAQVHPPPPSKAAGGSSADLVYCRPLDWWARCGTTWSA